MSEHARPQRSEQGRAFTPTGTDDRRPRSLTIHPTRTRLHVLRSCRRDTGADSGRLGRSTPTASQTPANPSQYGRTKSSKYRHPRSGRKRAFLGNRSVGNEAAVVAHTEQLVGKRQSPNATMRRTRSAVRSARHCPVSTMTKEGRAERRELRAHKPSEPEHKRMKQREPARCRTSPREEPHAYTEPHRTSVRSRGHWREVPNRQQHCERKRSERHQPGVRRVCSHDPCGTRRIANATPTSVPASPRTTASHSRRTGVTRSATERSASHSGPVNASTR